MNERVRLQIAAINKMKITFSITVVKHDDPEVIKRRAMPSIRRFRYNDYIYTDIQFNPLVTLDMSKVYSANEPYDARTRVNFGRLQFPRLIEDLEMIIDGFNTEGLYYTVNGKLYLDKSKVAPEMTDILLKGCNFKGITVNYVTVNNADTMDTYEGVVFHFNCLDNFVTLTYDELIELHGVLKSINLETLGLALFNTNENISRILQGESVEEYSLPNTETAIQNKMIPNREVIEVTKPIIQEKMIPKI